MPDIKKFIALLAVLASASAVAQDPKVLNLYSSRHYQTDEALYGNFADLSGVKINRIDAEPDPLVERLKAEGVMARVVSMPSWELFDDQPQ